MNIHPDRLLQIAATLGNLAISRSDLALSQWKLEKDIEGRKLFLTPPEGWPGKNEEQRKTAAQQAYTADEILFKMDAEWDAVRAQLAGTDANLSALEAERRALEWVIRAQLVSALTGVDRQPDLPVEESAFDDAMLGQADEALFASGPHPNGKPGIAGIYEDIPF